MAGIRSPAAFWLGGAAAPPPPPVTVKAGRRSLLAFWLGGASAPTTIEPPATPPAPVESGDDDWEELHAAQLRADDDVILALVAAAAAVYKGMST